LVRTGDLPCAAPAVVTTSGLAQVWLQLLARLAHLSAIAIAKLPDDARPFLAILAHATFKRSYAAPAHMPVEHVLMSGQAFLSIKSARVAHRAYHELSRSESTFVSLKEAFRKFAKDAACAVGSSIAFFAAVVIVVLWAVLGPVFNFSDTWQLVINTGTTIITFLMVFLIQATQNRDSEAIHLKLDELIRAVSKARTSLVGLENLPEDELKELQSEFSALQTKYAARMRARNERPNSNSTAQAP
jgi:low affinity Fe/Cu permease